MTMTRLRRVLSSLAALGGIGLVGLGVLARQSDALAGPAPTVAVMVTGPAGGSTVSTALPRPHGTGAPGYAVEVVDELGGTVCGALVNPVGRWRCSIATPQANGVRVWAARQSLTPGGAVQSRASVRFIIAAAGGPAAVLITSPASDDQLTAGPRTVTGTGAPGYLVRLIDTTGAAVCVTRIAADHRWSCRTVLPGGRRTLIASEQAGPTADLVSVATIGVTVASR